MTESAGLSLWVIYDHPSDHPGHFVLRRQVAFNGWLYPDPAFELALSAHTLRRRLQARGLTLIQPPGADPDPAVLEVWA